jgi:thiamine biosynthesis lipoprotein
MSDEQPDSTPHLPAQDPLAARRPVGGHAVWRVVIFAAVSLVILGVLVRRQRRAENLTRPAPNHPGRYICRFETMGTVGTLVLLAPDQATADRWARAALEAVRAVHREMSTYRAESELSRLNQAAGAGPVRVGADLFGVIAYARELSERTGGAFDVSYSPLRDVWRGAAARGSLPSEEELAEARRRVGWQKIVLDPDARTVRFAEPGMKLDLGSVAKGFALDLAVDALVEAGCTRGFVDIGGDLRLLGSAENGRPWVVGVRDPLKPGNKRAVMRRLRLGAVAVATSGGYERYFEIDGKRYSHILNPATGRPAGDLVSATVVAPTGIQADGLATAVTVLGMEAGLALIEETPGAECLLMAREDGGILERRSSGFTAFEEPEP